MSAPPGSPARRAAGFTLIELVIAAGLMTLLLVALLGLVDDFISLWDKSELRRQGIEEATGVSELLASDLSALEAGPRGDLLAEWVFFDTDGDGVAEAKWPRVRLLRHATPRELQLLQAGGEAKEPGAGLLEVIWAVLPARARSPNPDLRAEGYLWRGERLAGSREGLSIFHKDFLSHEGHPAPGAVHEVAGGVLWMGLLFATQTSGLGDGWELGVDLDDCRPGWDAWKQGRANAERHVWNEFGEGLMRVTERPLLPRRVRIELELEREKDLARRTRLARFVEPGEGSLELDDGSRVPAEAGAFVLVDAEWMRVLAVSGDTLRVQRGARGTTPGAHQPGALVHHGMRILREVPIALQREDWDL